MPTSLDPRDAAAILARIQAAPSLLLVAHADPDGDAVGSLLGLGWLLTALGKQPVLACQDPLPDSAAWLPGAGQVVRRAPAAPGLVISLDCSDPRRLGRVFDAGAADLPLVNIDHHVTNTRFGALNWVDPACVATAQMVLLLADALGWALTAEAATCLLAGIVTDTRGLRTANVDAEALRAVLRLVEAGAPLAETMRRTLDERPLGAVRLWAEALGGMTLDGGILWTAITHDMRRRWSPPEDAASGLSNFLSGVREADVVAVFTERNHGAVDVGLRAAPGLDVSGVALALGGGGHPQAAGCTLEGGLEAVREQVLAALRRSLEEQR